MVAKTCVVPVPLSAVLQSRTLPAVRRELATAVQSATALASNVVTKVVAWMARFEHHRPSQLTRGVSPMITGACGEPLPEPAGRVDSGARPSRPKPSAAYPAPAGSPRSGGAVAGEASRVRGRRVAPPPARRTLQAAPAAGLRWGRSPPPRPRVARAGNPAWRGGRPARGPQGPKPSRGWSAATPLGRRSVNADVNLTHPCLETPK